MLTGEYLVLKGADSLALPLKVGQNLEVRISEGISSLQWKTFEKSNFWFDAHYSLPEMAIGNTNNFQIAKNLRTILFEAKKLNPDFLVPGKHYEVITNLEFLFKWGFGSSSSLIVNIAQWAKVNPFELNSLVSNGSGYDIAAAMAKGPILYNMGEEHPLVKPVNFDPVFKDHLYFVYLGEKKVSQEEVLKFEKSGNKYSRETSLISEISASVLRSNNLIDFTRALKEHEEIIASVLELIPIKKKRFDDFNGFVKSLGAWGGDFVMFISDYPADYINSYMKRKNLNTWFHYRDLVSTSNAYSNV